MRPGRLVLAAGVAALVSAAVALADKGATDIKAVSATLGAKPVETRTSTCGDVKVSRVAYSGTSTSADARLAGNLRARITWVVNTKTGDGFASGELSVRDAKTGKRLLGAELTGVVSHITLLDGFLKGEAKADRGHDVKLPASAKDKGDNAVRLLANFSLAADSQGALSGELGSESPVGPHNSAVLLGGRACGGDH